MSGIEAGGDLADWRQDEEISRAIGLWGIGEEEARNRLVSLMYPELKRIAERRMRLERADHTFQPTALVNEFFLHLAKLQGPSLKSRTHFLALASQMMKRLLIDYARARNSEKHGGGAIQLQIDALKVPIEKDVFDLVELGELLDRLSHEEPRMAEIFDMRCFGGLTNDEIAEVLAVDSRTVKRDWQLARAWIIGQLRKGV